MYMHTFPNLDNFPSRKHAYIFFTPLNPTFMWWNWGLQGYTLFFLFLLKNIDCGNLCFEQKCEEYQIFLSEHFQFLVVKFSVYLNRHVFVMQTLFYMADKRKERKKMKTKTRLVVICAIKYLKHIDISRLAFVQEMKSLMPILYFSDLFSLSLVELHKASAAERLT